MYIIQGIANVQITRESRSRKVKSFMDESMKVSNFKAELKAPRIMNHDTCGTRWNE